MLLGAGEVLQSRPERFCGNDAEIDLQLLVMVDPNGHRSLGLPRRQHALDTLKADKPLDNPLAVVRNTEDVDVADRLFAPADRAGDLDTLCAWQAPH